LYARCLARFEAISARFSDFPAPDINSKGQWSYCATRSYFLYTALLHVQKLRPAKRVNMAFKVPQMNCSSFTKGYFEGIPSFKWCELKNKEEIGNGSFGSVCKASHVPENRTVVVKRFFGEGDANLKNVSKEARMLQKVRHSKKAEFIGVCSKPVAIMMEYEYFDFSPFGLDHQVSDLLDFLHCLDRVKTICDAFEHFLPMFPTVARDLAKGLAFLHSNDIVHRT